MIGHQTRLVNGTEERKAGDVCLFFFVLLMLNLSVCVCVCVYIQTARMSGVSGSPTASAARPTLTAASGARTRSASLLPATAPW